MIKIIQRRSILYVFSGLLLAAGLFSLFNWGLKFGMDFTGGSLLEVEFAATRPDSQTVTADLNKLELGNINLQPVGERGVILRFKEVDEDKHQSILKSLREVGSGDIAEKRFESIGPIIGAELKSRSLWAIGLALFFIVSYIAWAFRKVSRPVASWKYGLAAVVALVHDLLIVIGAFSALGHFAGVEIDSLFVTALLTVLGFSVHDTIVVFDRTRENLFRGLGGDFENTVNQSVNETIVRSINTSVTTLLVLSTLYLFGGDTIRYFALALIIGITVGTYSSIFVASPLIVDWHKFGLKAQAVKK